MARKNHRKQPMAEPSQSVPNAPPVAVTREVSISPGFASLYANDVQIQMTPWDMRLIFGEITDLPTPDRPSVKIMSVGELRVSPQLAKRLTMVILGQLKAYEDEYGTIPFKD